MITELNSSAEVGKPPSTLRKTNGGRQSTFMMDERSPTGYLKRPPSDFKRVEIFKVRPLPSRPNSQAEPSTSKCARTVRSWSVKRSIAQKLLLAGQSSALPQGADIAHEISKCHALGFGIPVDFAGMHTWLTTAADRGHQMASAILAQLKITQHTHSQSARPVEFKTLNSDTSQFYWEYNHESMAMRFLLLNMDHVDNFELFN